MALGIAKYRPRDAEHGVLETFLAAAAHHADDASDTALAPTGPSKEPGRADPSRPVHDDR
ncbi:MAG TPA: hypothetical protein VGU22_12045 [Methylomirabilota bacterium]|jgi:hypothetical protein|nr:hypothetical protein [Methylomirabilota bacterium]